ncbi:MAG: hypothetical protein PHH13_05495 [Candidatus Peribacteraceae bacterium]|nr:hypothetical protein [Candidatus Peribacteraceae bacterium]
MFTSPDESWLTVPEDETPPDVEVLRRMNEVPDGEDFDRSVHAMVDVVDRAEGIPIARKVAAHRKALRLAVTCMN